jgi:hypothetical protein
MSDDSVEPGVDGHLIGDFLAERATINPARIIEHGMIICPSFAATRKVVDFGLFIQPRLGASMKRWQIAVLFVIGCSLSASAGFWFGFREAWQLGIAADFLPRGVIAAQQLQALKAGKTHNLAVALEFDVDNGLIWGHEVFGHPLRSLWKPIWSLDVYPNYEQYAIRLANYRKEHPSLMKPDTFDKVPPDQEHQADFYRDLAQGARESTTKLNSMIERYATKR